jgi:hypothetical protein
VRTSCCIGLRSRMPAGGAPAGTRWVSPAGAGARFKENFGAEGYDFPELLSNGTIADDPYGSSRARCRQAHDHGLETIGLIAIVGNRRSEVDLNRAAKSDPSGWFKMARGYNEVPPTRNSQSATSQEHPCDQTSLCSTLDIKGASHSTARRL